MPQVEPQPWKTLETTWIVDHPWLAVVEDLVELPTGARVRWVREADEREGRQRLTVALGICRDDRGRILVARQWNHGPQLVLDEFPAGRIESGESAEEAIRRELQEEVGVYAATLEPLGYFLTNTRRFGLRIEVFLGTDLEERWLPGDDAEEIAADWWEAAEIDRAIADGRFVSGGLLSPWALYRARYPR